ncbi:MAG: response regulator [Porphyromonadaceae bacterium]|nr:response regulator [Porphyromonadaceae bacterium]
MNKSVLIVDDNLTVCLMLKSWLVKRGFLVETATSASDAKQRVKEQPFDLILTDIRMPDADGITFLSWVKKYDSDIIVIMITGYADVESAVLSMKAGAADYIPKPIEPEHLFKKIEEAFQTQEYRNKKSRFSNDFILPPGKEYQLLFRQLDQIAEHNEYRLLIGDRGTGKVSAVKYIYEKGIHPSRPLVQLDPDQLNINKRSSRQYTDSEENESPLMEKFFAARGGLLYIRKVDQLDLNLQNELLNILTKQSRDEHYTQIIMSTEKSITELEKSLIPKLFRLLGEKSITLPTIKGKKQVIDAFVSYFLQFANQMLDKQIQTIDQTIYNQMYEYAWPENIQELKNSVIQAALLTEGKHMPAELASRLFEKNIIKQENNLAVSTPMLNLRKENYEKEKIVEALRLAKGNKTMAASILNIDRKTLYNKIKLYNVIT